MSYQLRPVTPADGELILRLYGVSREAELAPVPWSEAQKLAFLQHQVAAQERHYWERYPHSEHLVVEVAGRPVGRLWLDRQGERIHIIDLILDPEDDALRTQILRDRQEEAAVKKQAVTIYLESFHPSLPLFAQLGFAKAGEEGAHFRLVWSTAPDATR